ncbi:Telomerase protein component 1 [Frankliniella fusca]|uniref:Telomerase protein component 1 n=1 Tax=Frankliniella fusca TaxID=407009 RepID=A0AAE1HER9_9NEOP|nr:Telomerase protein component 1 [Frankliniella fusca]
MQYIKKLMSTNLYDNHFPIKKVIEKDPNKKLWTTTGIKITSRNYRDLCIFMKTTSDPVLLKYFKKYRTIYKQVIKKAKCIHNQRTILDSENKSKTIWSVINNNIGKSRPDHKNLKVRREEGSPTTENPEAVSNIFCVYYFNVIHDLQENNPDGTVDRIWMRRSSRKHPGTIRGVMERPGRIPFMSTFCVSKSRPYKTRPGRIRSLS